MDASVDALQTLVSACFFFLCVQVPDILIHFAWEPGPQCGLPVRGAQMWTCADESPSRTRAHVNSPRRPHPMCPPPPLPSVQLLRFARCTSISSWTTRDLNAVRRSAPPLSLQFFFFFFFSGLLFFRVVPHAACQVFAWCGPLASSECSASFCHKKTLNPEPYPPLAV